MKVEISSKNKAVIASGVVSAYEDDGDITFHLVEDSFSLWLKLIFSYDDNSPEKILLKSNGSFIEFNCLNFSNAGTGTTEPIKIAQIGEKKIYIRFWAYLEGELTGKKKTRKVEYTFFCDSEGE